MTRNEEASNSTESGERGEMNSEQRGELWREEMEILNEVETQLKLLVSLLDHPFFKKPQEALYEREADSMTIEEKVRSIVEESMSLIGKRKSYLVRKEKYEEGSDTYGIMYCIKTALDTVDRAIRTQPKELGELLGKIRNVNAALEVLFQKLLARYTQK